MGLISLRVNLELVGEVFGVEAWACFFDDHRQPTVVQQECCTRGAPGITRRPLIGADIVELNPQECMQQILCVELIFHA